MRHAEFERKLKDAGFQIIRHGKHPQWSDGISRITMPSGGRSIDTRLLRQLKIDLRRAQEKRAALMPVQTELTLGEKEEVNQFNQPRMFADKPVVQPQPVANPVPLKEKRVTEDELFAIVEPMRKEGRTNADIVRFLDHQMIHTVSGRSFDGPMISKICLERGGIRRKKRTSVEEMADRIIQARKIEVEQKKQEAETATKDLVAQIADICTSNLGDATKRALIKDMAAKL